MNGRPFVALTECGPKPEHPKGQRVNVFGPLGLWRPSRPTSVRLERAPSERGSRDSLGLAVWTGAGSCG